jgi:hypothetical protein
VNKNQSTAAFSSAVINVAVITRFQPQGASAGTHRTADHRTQTPAACADCARPIRPRRTLYSPGTVNVMVMKERKKMKEKKVSCKDGLFFFFFFFLQFLIEK